MNTSSNAHYIQNLYQHTEKIFKLGFDEGGACTALAYSQRLHDRTTYVKKEMQMLEMQVHYDAGGNLFGLLEGKSSQKILITSHVDSVVNAGRYDGVLGVVLGLELVRWIKDNNIELNYSIEIMVCMGEESPGVTATFGSKLATGYYSLKQLEEMSPAFDRSTSVKKAIDHYFREFDGQENFDFDQQALEGMQLSKEGYKVALEIHIEQFFLLQNLAKAANGMPYIGVMRGVGGHLRQNLYLEDKDFSPVVNPNFDMALQLTFSGTPSHSGATPMGREYRDDAVVKAATFLLKLGVSNWNIEAKLAFTDFEIQQPALTSISQEATVGVLIKSSEYKAFKEFLKLFGEGILVKEDKIEKAAISSSLVFAMAAIVDALNESAKTAKVSDEVRATITQLQFDEGGKAQCFCDIRGASNKGMDQIGLAIDQVNMPESILKKKEVVSKKAPAIFDKQLTKEVEEVLGEHFDGRIMKGNISVPGQDIGILSSYGIPSSLLFIESGTGHHPNEYVREEAMEQAFKAVQTLFNYWNQYL